MGLLGAVATALQSTQGATLFMGAWWLRTTSTYKKKICWSLLVNPMLLPTPGNYRPRPVGRFAFSEKIRDVHICMCRAVAGGRRGGVRRFVAAPARC
jgi:hypothetical protein